MRVIASVAAGGGAALSLPLHTIAHAVALRLSGVGVARVEIWPEGGWAVPLAEFPTWKQQLAVRGAGPAFDAVACAALLGSWWYTADGHSNAYHAAFLVPAAWQLGATAWNFAPLPSHDGGRMLFAVLIGPFQRDAVTAAHILMVLGRALVAVPLAPLGLILAWQGLWLGLVLFAVGAWVWWHCGRSSRALAAYERVRGVPIALLVAPAPWVGLEATGLPGEGVCPFGVVVSQDGRTVAGILDQRRQLMLRHEKHAGTAAALMLRAEDLPAVPSVTDAGTVLWAMDTFGASFALLTDGGVARGVASRWLIESAARQSDLPAGDRQRPLLCPAEEWAWRAA
jgi:hypothetical protein